MEMTKVLTCGNCHKESTVLLTGVAAPLRRTYIDQQGKPGIAYASRNPDADAKTRAVFHGACPRCYETTVIVARFDGPETPPGTPLRATALTDVEQYPPPERAVAPPVWPATLQTAWTDVLKVRAADASAATILATAGTCLQHALRLLRAEGKTMFDEIEDLHRQNIITQGLRDWSHDLRDKRNKGTHDFTGTEADAAELVEFLRIFLHLTFTLPAEIAQRRSGGTAGT
jgi:hypothetical protein